MNWCAIKVLCLLFLSVIISACAPVKFSKSNTFAVVPQCSGEGCGPSGPPIKCDPKINGSASTFTYVSNGALPSISSNCSPANNDYTWTVKRADSSVINTSIPGLSGANPQGVNFTGLGPGAYYVYLTASQSSSAYASFTATTPLEFIVSPIGNQLTCDPRLNRTQTSVTIGADDSNAEVSANCNPAAGTYVWTVTKDGNPLTVAGLSGGASTPNIKSYGVGTYKISLYATATGSQHWRSSTPLTINVTETGVNPPQITCNPRIDGTLTSISLISSSPHPLISANCVPSNVTYQWSVTRNGNPVSLPSLTGANSNPNFLALGSGTYLVYLKASTSGYSHWNTTTPLTITVNPTGAGQTLSCAPRLNGTAVALTITQSGMNPAVTANCSPSASVHTWTVFKNGAPVTISGLNGPSSTPDFIGAGFGTYYIYLTATLSGYNAYASPAPLEVTVAQNPSPTRTVIFEKLVQTTDNKVDILVVVDDSNSMLPDNKKLAERLQGFVNDLSNSGLDWQMCATVTHSQRANDTMYWGLSRNWVDYVGSPQWILNMGATDPYSIFTKTIDAIGAGWADTDDERAIKAAWWHTEYKQYNTCYRKDASLAVIILSDEDERSVGGDANQAYYSGEFKLLEGDDQPHGYINKIRQSFGLTKRFTVNSIIVKPGDTACMNAQDAGNSKSHYGYKYQDLSQLTGGYVGSICDTNYSNNLYYFKDRIVNSMASVPLECAPVGPIEVSITPTMGTVNSEVQNNTLVFNPVIPAGRTVNIKYDCAQQ